MSLLALALALGVGALTGALSGLLGIGGGSVLVPFLYLLMANPEWSGIWVDPSQQATMAHATSLAVIVPTALSGILSYRRHGLVDWNVVVPLGLSAALAAVVGAQIAVHLPSELLKVLFGALLLWIGGRMLGVFRQRAWQGTWRRWRRKAERGKAEPRTPGRTPDAGVGPEVGLELGPAASPVPGSAAEREAPSHPGGAVPLRPGLALAGGGVVGLLSALLGIGGGVVAVPLLVRFARMDLHRVTAASIGIVGFAAPAGILSYAWAGRGVEGFPPGSMGFVSLPLAAALVPGAILMAPLGARLNRRLPLGTLRRLFGAFLLAMGLRLLWVYLPAVIP